MRGLSRSLALLAAGGALAFAAPADVSAHGDGRSPAGEPGDPQKAARTVEIVMSEAADGMRYSPDRVEVREGEQVRFVVRNSGTLLEPSAAHQALDGPEMRMIAECGPTP